MKTLFKTISEVKFRGIFNNNGIDPPRIDKSILPDPEPVVENISKKVEKAKGIAMATELKIESLGGVDIGPLVEMFKILKGAVGGDRGSDFESESLAVIPNDTINKQSNKYVGTFEFTGKMSIEKFKKEAVKYEGTPYELGGQGIGGMDCSGLLVAIAKNLGIATGDTTAYGFYDMSAEIETSEVKPGDAMFWMESGGGVSHVAVITHINSDGTYTTIESTTDGSGGVQSFSRDLSPDREIRRLPFMA